MTTKQLTLSDLHGELISYLKEGKFAEGIEEFYAEGVIARENSGAPKRGRTALAQAERDFLIKVEEYHGIDVLGTALDDQDDGSGTVFYECVMRWRQADKGEVVVNQTVVERWKDGKVQSIRFYGDFDPA